MTEIDRDNPFMAGPVPDPASNEDGIIWAAQHSQEVSGEDGVEAVSQAKAARGRGGLRGEACLRGDLAASHKSAVLSSLLTLTNLKLDELAECINLAFVPTAGMSIPAWAAALIPEEGISSGLPVELLADACISNYRSLEPEVLEVVMQDPDLIVAYDQALLGTALLSAYRSDDGAALDGLLQTHTHPLEVLSSLRQVFDYLASEVDDTAAR